MKVHPINPSNPPAAIANTSEKCSSCCVTLKILATALVSVLIIYFAVHMATETSARRHITTIPKLEIDSLIAYNFTLSSRPDQIYADWNVEMNLESKNSHGYLSFSNITVSIYQNVLQVGLTNVIPFDVVPLNSTRHFDVKFSGSSGLTGDSIINGIRGLIIGASGTLTFDVIFEASVKKSFKGRWTDHLQLCMDCKDIKLVFGYSDKSRAQMLNPPHTCKVMGDI